MLSNSYKESHIKLEQAVDDFLGAIKDCSHVWIAYSGGVDSHALLHCLAAKRQTQPQLTMTAIHIHHGLQAQAQQWAQHCQTVCQDLGITCQLEYVDAQPAGGESPEAVARKARYQVFHDLVQARDYLLVAHHQDDQAETVILQMTRGAGPKGLAAMPKISQFSQGYLARPLLEVSRSDVLDYAKHYQLQWVEDESNADLVYERNFIRHQIMPLLKQRRPTVEKALARSARHCAEAQVLCDALAQIDLSTVQLLPLRELSAKQLRLLPVRRQRNVIRYWLRQHKVTLPSEVKISHIIHDVIYSQYQAKPCVAWGNVKLQRHKDRIFLIRNQN